MLNTTETWCDLAWCVIQCLVSSGRLHWRICWRNFPPWFMFILLFNTNLALHYINLAIFSFYSTSSVSNFNVFNEDHHSQHVTEWLDKLIKNMSKCLSQLLTRLLFWVDELVAISEWHLKYRNDLKRVRYSSDVSI